MISSDFCHWGANFDFTPYDESKGEIYESIEAMDREGVSFIEKQDADVGDFPNAWDYSWSIYKLGICYVYQPYRCYNMWA